MIQYLQYLINQNRQNMQTIKQITLKHLRLIPNTIQLKSNQSLLVKISYDNAHGLSELQNSSNCFFFCIEQLDLDFGPLKEGQSYEIKFPETPGSYSLICTNYPKILCNIEVSEGKKVKKENLQMKIEKKSAQKQDKQKEQQNVQCMSNDSSPSKYNDYDRVLEDQNQSLNNRYLRYFKQQFALWRNFFQNQPIEKSPIVGECAKIEKNNESNSINVPKPAAESLVRPNSATLHNEIPVLLQKSNAISLNSNQTNSLNSNHSVDRQQQMHTPVSRGMKKTSSEYLQYIDYSEDDIIQSDTQCIVDSAINWAVSHELGQVLIEVKEDENIIKQYLSYLHNKFQLSKFLHS